MTNVPKRYLAMLAMLVELLFTSVLGLSTMATDLLEDPGPVNHRSLLQSDDDVICHAEPVVQGEPGELTFTFKEPILLYTDYVMRVEHGNKTVYFEACSLKNGAKKQDCEHDDYPGYEVEWLTRLTLLVRVPATTLSHAGSYVLRRHIEGDLPQVSCNLVVHPAAGKGSFLSQTGVPYENGSGEHRQPQQNLRKDDIKQDEIPGAASEDDSKEITTIVMALIPVALAISVIVCIVHRCCTGRWNVFATLTEMCRRPAPRKRADNPDQGKGDNKNGPVSKSDVKSGEDPSKFLTGDAADDAKPSQDDPVGDRTTSPLMENGGTSGANTAEDHGTTGDVSSTASVLRAFGQGLRSVGSLFTRAQSALRGQRDSGTADVSEV